MQRHPSLIRRTSLAALALLASGCANWPGNAVPESETLPAASEPLSPAALERQQADRKRIGELEHLLAERQRKCNEEKSRLEATNRESQARLDAAQTKLNKLLAVERDFRNAKGK